MKNRKRLCLPDSKIKNIIKIPVTVLLCLSLLLLCSCSAVTGVLDSLGLEEVGEKVSEAWNEVGKEAMDEWGDSLWREYGFGSDLHWPEKGNGKNVPVFRDGEWISDYISADFVSGVLYFSDVTDDEKKSYIEYIESYGYDPILVFSSLSDVHVFDGLFIGFYRNGENLAICYSGSVAGLDEVFSNSNIK